MKTLYMMKGLPACGKSTRAKQMLSELGNGNAKVVNKDLLRLMLDDGKWSRENEKFLLGVRDRIVTAALSAGKHVIVDDTNLSSKHGERLRQLARESGALFEVIDMTHVALDECIERDRKRPNYVGEKVIRDMHRQFLAVPVEAYPHDPSLPECVICDIDGTVAEMCGRGPFEWDKVGDDNPRTAVLDAVARCAKGRDLIFVSGRDAVCADRTIEWLKAFMLRPFLLFMRPAGDQRRDSIVKREIFDQNIRGKYNIAAVFDDRPQVIRECWQAMGLGDRLLNVGDGTEF